MMAFYFWGFQFIGINRIGNPKSKKNEVIWGFQFLEIYFPIQCLKLKILIFQEILDWNLLGHHLAEVSNIRWKTQPLNTDDHIFRRRKLMCVFRISPPPPKKKMRHHQFTPRISIPMASNHGDFWMACVHVSRPVKHWAPWEDLTKRPWKLLGPWESGSGWNHGYSTNPPRATYPPQIHKGLIAGLIKGNQWLISP